MQMFWISNYGLEENFTMVESAWSGTWTPTVNLMLQGKD